MHNICIRMIYYTFGKNFNMLDVKIDILTLPYSKIKKYGYKDLFNHFAHSNPTNIIKLCANKIYYFKIYLSKYIRIK
jgi:hypothetical protein